jgi:hypothetical protein
MAYDGLRRLPCLLCDWEISYDPFIPGLRQHAMEEGFKHYSRVHAMAVTHDPEAPRGV